MHEQQGQNANHDRNYGIALLSSTVLGLITMAMHPSGPDLLRDFETYGPRNIFAHGIAMLGVPLSLVGLLPLMRRLHAADGSFLADLGGALYLVASGAVMVAAAASGLIAPAIAERILATESAAREMWMGFFSFNGTINQSFATIYVIGLALAIVVWSIAIRRTRAFPQWLAGFGVAVGLALLVLMGSGRAHLDVHTFGLIVLAQAVWMTGLAVHFIKR